MLFPFEVDMDTCEILFTSQDSIVLLFIYIPIDGMEAKMMSSRENNPTFLRGKCSLNRMYINYRYLHGMGPRHFDQRLNNAPIRRNAMSSYNGDGKRKRLEATNRDS